MTILTTISLWLAAGGALSILAALTRLWPFAQRILWDRVPAKWRPWLSTVPAVLGCVTAIVATPADWLTQVEALLVVLTPLLAPGTLPAGAKHAAVLVLVGGIGIAQTGCSVGFEESRPKAPISSMAVGGVRLLEPGSPECLNLSRQQHTWNGLALAGVILGTSGTAGALIDLGIRDQAKAEVYVMLALGGALDAAAVFAKVQADGYAADYVAAGCAGAPAP